jgi:hypothetical protein
MAIPDDKVKIQTVVPKDLAAKIDYFAERFEVSQSKMTALMLESCIEDEGWLLQLMSTNAVKKVFRAFGKKGKTKVNIEVAL